jgi:cell division protein FtsB
MNTYINKLMQNQRRLEKLDQIIFEKQIVMCDLAGRTRNLKYEIESIVHSLFGSDAAFRNMEILRKIREKENRYRKLTHNCMKLQTEIQLYKDDYNNLKPIILEEIHVARVSRKEMGAVSREVCGVCLEARKMKDMIKTNCRHNYCAECFVKWMYACNRRSCPYCRSEVLAVEIYKTAQYGRPHNPRAAVAL